jgi:arsenate reductase-like glutaredoxin family protein
VNAAQQRYGASDLSEVLGDARTLVVAKGKQVLTFDLARDAPSAAELARVMLGPTGNLRAPTARVGKQVLVGFSPDAYGDVFG